MLSRVIGPSAALIAALALTACGGELDDSELDRYLCNQEMFGENVRESARGEITAADLERLGDGDGQPPRGAVSAKFALYTSALPRPPFDPPGDIVCQAVEFRTESDAGRWVAGLTSNERLDGIVVGFLADGGSRREATVPREVRERSPAGDLRVFVAEPGHGREQGVVMIAVGTDGRVVRSLGWSGERLVDSSAAQVAAWWLEAHPR